MAKNIQKIEERVLNILITYPDARGSDFVLYARYLQEYNPELNGVGLIYALTEAKRLNMPNYETITRARRKVQERIPDLKPPKAAQKKRAASERAFREYAREK